MSKLIIILLFISTLTFAQELNIQTFHLNAEQFNGMDSPAEYNFSSPTQVKIPRILKLLAGRTSVDIVNLKLDFIVCQYYPIAQEHIFLFRSCTSLFGTRMRLDANEWMQVSKVSLYFPYIDTRINLKQAEATIYYR